MTRICIFGAGAIGGYMAAALDKAGADVSLVASDRTFRLSVNQG